MAENGEADPIGRLLTDRVMRSMHRALWTAAANDGFLERRLEELLASGERDRLSRWLTQQNDNSRVSSDEKLSNDFLEWAQESARLTEHDRKGLREGRAALLRRWLQAINERPPHDMLHSLLASGLGLVFIRYNAAQRHSYYHFLGSELIPEQTRIETMQAVSVPQGRGTIGWIALRALAQARRYREAFLARPTPVTLWSCFSDPRGRVATEDLVVGNRSFVALPIFGREVSGFGDGRDVASQPTLPVGVVFAFFPVDGLFLTPLLVEAPFVGKFRDVVLSHRSDLLAALDGESWMASHGVLARSSFTPKIATVAPDPLDRVLDEILPLRPRVDEPLGILVALALDGNATKSRLTHVRLREHAVVDQAHRVRSLSSLHPDGWGRDEVGRIQQAAKQAEAAPTPSTLSPPKVSDNSSPGFSFDAVRANMASLFSGDDLLVPLVAGGRCYAVLRVTPSAQAATDVPSVLSSLELDFGARGPFAELLLAVAQLLEGFDRAEALQNLTPEQTKTLEDLRYAMCDGIVARFIRRSGEGPEAAARSSIALLATAFLSADGGVDQGPWRDAVIRLTADAEHFDDLTISSELTAVFDRIALVSLWLMTKHWVIDSLPPHQSDALAQLLLEEDPGLAQVLAYLHRFANLLVPAEHEISQLLDPPPEDEAGQWTFDLSEYAHVPLAWRKGIHSGMAVLPPAFLPGKSDRVYCRVGRGREHRTVTLRREGETPFEFTMRLTVSPMPSAVRFQSGKVCDILLGGLTAPPLSHLATAPQATATLSGEGTPGSLIERTRRLQRFLAPAATTPFEWDRTQLDHGGGKLLLTMHQPQPGVTGGGSDVRRPALVRAVQTFEVLAAQRQELLRAEEGRRAARQRHVRHQLRNEYPLLFDQVDLLLEGKLSRDGLAYHRNRLESLATLLDFLIEDNQNYLPDRIGSILVKVATWRFSPAHRPRLTVEIDAHSDLDACLPGIADVLAPLVAPKTWMYMLLSNLIDNARKFSQRSKGQVWVRQRVGAIPGRVLIEIENEGPNFVDVEAFRSFLQDPDAPHPTTAREQERGGSRAKGFDLIRDALRVLGAGPMDITSPRPGGDGTLIAFEVPGINPGKRHV